MGEGMIGLLGVDGKIMYSSFDGSFDWAASYVFFVFGENSYAQRSL